MLQFSELLPEKIFATVTRQGFHPTGALLPLNSYENRVYEIALEGQAPIVGKFYRPGRWTIDAIAEEHAFLAALAEHEIPVVQSLPLQEHLPECEALASTDEMFYAFFPKFRGREHAEITLEDLRWLGRTLGRLHNIGAKFKAPHRIRLDPQSYGYDSLEFILTLDFVPADLMQNIEIFLHQALERVEPFFERKMETIVVHGDCHPGNILWNPEGPHLLDFDDMVLAPPVQDLWMLFYGTEEEKRQQQEAFFVGYEMFREFDYSTLRLAEPLRTLRMIRHTAWIGKRHEEPIFQRSFPYYRERRYWEEFLLSMKEQVALLQEV